jgi:hypothetical protein
MKSGLVSREPGVVEWLVQGSGFNESDVGVEERWKSGKNNRESTSEGSRGKDKGHACTWTGLLHPHGQ